jgi:2-oxoglutaroyl-CoA hydrolase
MTKNYAEDRAALLRELDGLRVEIDGANKIGHLILDRPPLNIVSYRGRSQIRALIEAMDEDDDVGVIVIRGQGGL